MTKQITLEKWAERQFEEPPCRATLRRWVQTSKIWPRPKKVGRAYLVDPKAQYIDPSDTDDLLERIRDTQAP